MNETPKPKTKSDRLKPLSFHPLTPERALRAFMQVDPKKVLAAERKALTTKSLKEEDIRK